VANPRPVRLHPALDPIDLVVFDKDGTLIDFPAMWVPWALELASDLEASTGRRLAPRLFDLLGFDPATGRTVPSGGMASTPMLELRAQVIDLLAAEGLDAAAIESTLVPVWHAPDPTTAEPLADLQPLFGALRGAGKQIAVATNDDREPTLATLASLGIGSMIEAVVCGDDEHEVKPAAAMIVHLADLLGVRPGSIAVIGDSPADLAMGRAAGAGLLVGVLSGVGTTTDLEPLADMILPSIAELLIPAGR
jgi:phosphoglycolate phosphatase